MRDKEDLAIQLLSRSYFSSQCHIFKTANLSLFYNEDLGSNSHIIKQSGVSILPEPCLIPSGETEPVCFYIIVSPSFVLLSWGSTPV